MILSFCRILANDFSQLENQPHRLFLFHILIDSISVFCDFHFFLLRRNERKNMLAIIFMILSFSHLANDFFSDIRINPYIFHILNYDDMTRFRSAIFFFKTKGSMLAIILVFLSFCFVLSCLASPMIFSRIEYRNQSTPLDFNYIDLLGLLLFSLLKTKGRCSQ